MTKVLGTGVLGQGLLGYDIPLVVSEPRPTGTPPRAFDWVGGNIGGSLAYGPGAKFLSYADAAAGVVTADLDLITELRHRSDLFREKTDA